MKRVFGLALIALLITFSIANGAPAASRVYRIGYLSSGTASRASDRGIGAFRQRLRELGFIEGVSVEIYYRYAELDNERLPHLAAELLSRKIDVLVTSPDPPSIRAAQTATHTTPIIMPGAVIDPLASTFWSGKQREPLVASLARPNGNITGLTNLAAELHGKRLELLKEGVPRIFRVALLWPRAQQQKQTLQDIDAVRKVLGIEVQSLAAGSQAGFEQAFSEISRRSPDALLVARSQVILNHRQQIIEFATKKRLPTIFAESDFVDAGGLMSYGADIEDLYRRAAEYVNKIFKGSKPADLPIERPTKFEFVISLRTAKQIGLTIPPNVLARADRVIK